MAELFDPKQGRSLHAPLLLYSVNTRLAFHVNCRYYGDLHYVWCSPLFDFSLVPPLLQWQPPSSTPVDIYRQLMNETRRPDAHSPFLDEKRAGILHGAQLKRTNGEISPEDYDAINALVSTAERCRFEPLLYIIPFEAVRNRITPKPPNKGGNAFSSECVVERLPGALFDVVEFP